MDDVPVGSLLTLVVIDVVVVLLLSVVCGLAVARGAGRTTVRGVATGLLAPVVGPYVWGIVATSRRRELARIRRLVPRPTVTYATTACLVLAAAVFLVGMVAPLGHVGADYDKYAFATDASAADTVVGLIGSVMTALVALLVAAVTFVWTPWHRMAVALVTVASTWVLFCVDAVIVIHALGGVSENVQGISGGRADAAASAGGGLWCALLGACLMVVAAVLLAGPQRFAPSSEPASRPIQIDPAAPPATDWGDWGSAAPSAPSTDVWAGSDWGDPDPPTSPRGGQ